MAKKILIYSLRGLLLLLGVLILLTGSLYLAPVQRLLVTQAVSFVERETGLHLETGRLRVKFPLRLSLQDASLRDARGDTLVSCGELRLQAALWPLLRGEARVEGVLLRETAFDYRDSLTGLQLKGTLGALRLGPFTAKLPAHTANIRRIELSRGRVELTLGSAAAPDTIPGTMPDWKVRLETLVCEAVSFEMHAPAQLVDLAIDLAKGTARGAAVDLGGRQVSLGELRLEQGAYRYLFDRMSETDTLPSADSVSAGALPWTIRLGSLELADNRLDYGLRDKIPMAGRFDPDRIGIDSLNLRLDSLYNRGEDVSGRLRSLTLRERSGLAITRGEGGFSLDSLRVSLQDLALETPTSHLLADFHANASLLSGHSDAALQGQADLRLAAADLLRVYPVEARLRNVLREKSLTLNGQVDGSLARLGLHNLRVGMPGHMALHVDGQLQLPIAARPPGGDLRLGGVFTRIAFLKELLPDEELRQRLDAPERMTLSGHLSFRGQDVSPSLTLEVGEAQLLLKGRFDPVGRRYDVQAQARDFPLGDFLPHDSLGPLSLHLTAKGAGFDPTAAKTEAQVELAIDRLAYRGHRYDSLNLQAALSDHRLSGHLGGEAQALQMGLDLNGELRPGDYTARVKGRVAGFDLQRMGFSEQPLSGSFLLEANVAARPDTAYRLEVILDTIFLTSGYQSDSLRRIALRASAGSSSVTASLRSGDLSVGFDAPVPVDSLVGALDRLGSGVSAQLASARLDMNRLQQAMTPFRLEASAGRNNPLPFLLEQKHIDFDRLRLSVATDSTAPFHATARVEGLQSGSQFIDTLTLDLERQQRALTYLLRLGNQPRETRPVSLIAASGHLEGNRARIDLLQRDWRDSIGFRFTLGAELLDSAVRINFPSSDPLFGYLPWRINPDNYLLLYRDRHIEANLNLEHGDQSIRLLNATLPQMPRGALRVQVGGIGIASALRLIPGMPPVDGMLSTDLILGRDSASILLKGSATVDSLHYNSQRVGDLAVKLDWFSDSLGRRTLDSELTVDGRQVLTAGGFYRMQPEEPLDFRFAVPGLNLSAINPFLPEEAARLSGILRGQLHITGTTRHPLLDGQLALDSATLSVPAVATTFNLSPGPITLAGSILRFDRFGLIAAGGKQLLLDGTLDLKEFSKPVADMTLKGSGFPVVNAPRNRQSMIYGRTEADIDLRAKGRFDALQARGTVRILGSSNMTYTLRHSPLEIKDAKQHIVTFVSFRDSAALRRLETLAARPATTGMDIRVDVTIDPNTRATMNLSEDGENRIAVVGDGGLAFSMNPQGDTRLTGRYMVSQGTVLYSLPVVGEKTFQIQNGSYIDWSGEAADPAFNITAKETVSTSVASDESTSRKVDFDVSVNVRNTFKNMAISFDLEAPGDATIQNQLLALSPEERSTQAMNLLVYDTYTGPGTSAHVDGSNPLNAFIEREMNKWARNNLKNIDLSFGATTIDDSDTGGDKHTDYSYKVSKNLFNDRVTVSIGGKVSTDASTSEDVRQNAVDDISVEYRLSKRDNAYLKVYRYNTQVSVIEGDVTESGVGFVSRKKLNRLGHLFRLTRSPERKQEIQQKRALKKQIEQGQAPRTDTLPAGSSAIPASEGPRPQPAPKSQPQPPSGALLPVTDEEP